MSVGPCLNLKTDAIIANLNERLDLNISPEELDPDLEEMLNKYSKEIGELYNKYGKGVGKFDIVKFKNLVRKLYKKPKPSQNGGDDDEGEEVEEVVPYKEKPRTYYDFLAILSFLASIYICYLAYIKFNNLISLINNPQFHDDGSLKFDFQQAINNVKTAMEKENIDSDLTFFQFMYKSFFTYSCEEQAQHLVTFIQKVINVAVINASQRIIPQVTEICNLKTQVLQDDWGIVGKFVNGASASISALVTSDTTSKCVIEVTNLKLQQDLIQSGHLLKMLTTMTTTSVNQIATMIYVGTGIGIPSVMYLSYRLKELAKTVSGPKVPELPYDDTTGIMARGGRKTKKNKNRKTKKNKNRKTKKNKNRKTKKNKNRKNKNTKQMSR